MANSHLTPPVAGALATARRVLMDHGEPLPEERFGLEGKATADDRGIDACATLLMDLFRRSAAREVFDVMVRLIEPALMRRIRARIRQLGVALDPHEVFQDAMVNVFRYPDRFDGGRAGAFRAWSSTIVDNTIRRQLRCRRSGPDIQLQPIEILVQERDTRCPEPVTHASNAEECQGVVRAVGLLLNCYLDAYQHLSERERFVLQMVEVRGMRYSELATALGIRAEALKMVVFRARKRIQDHLTVIFCRAGVPAARAA